METPKFDIIVVGGGLAGSSLGGLLAQAGHAVLILEKESTFRDRVRGEITWPWGVAEIERAGLRPVVDRVEPAAIEAIRILNDRRVEEIYPFAPSSPGGLPALGFSHPRLQQDLLDWATAAGATILRPAKAVRYSEAGGPVVTIVHQGKELDVRARLVVGADGARSQVRKWAGGQAMKDPEHHRIGGVRLRGIAWQEQVLDVVSTASLKAFWFPIGAGAIRLYIAGKRAELHNRGLDRSFAAIAEHLAALAPDEPDNTLVQAGPIGYFPNSTIWSTRLASDHVVLIGDAAGASDPSTGMGTSLVFRDVRELSELLQGDKNWTRAVATFEQRRWRYYSVIREHDRWRQLLSFETGPEAEARLEGHRRARERDATLGGFALLESRGPDGLIADDTARQMFFGEDLS